MSLITTLIPAYKPDYLDEMWASLARQRITGLRVLLSDDSPGGEITAGIRDGRWGALQQQFHLTVVKGPGNARRNHLQLLDLWRLMPDRGPLVHMMMDDDVLLPDFYAAHVAAHAQGEFAVSVSARWFSHADSRPVSATALPDFIEASDLHRVPVDASALWPSIVPLCTNWLGELTNMVWSASGMDRFPRPPRDALNYYGLMDVSAVLEAVQHQPLVFIRDHLSVFRQHPGQTTHGIGTHGHRVGMVVWAACALHAWAQGRIDARQTLQAMAITVQRCLALYGERDEVINAFLDLVEREGHSLEQLHGAFTTWWLALLASHPGTRSD